MSKRSIAMIPLVVIIRHHQPEHAFTVLQQDAAQTVAPNGFHLLR